MDRTSLVNTKRLNKISFTQTWVDMQNKVDGRITTHLS